MATCRPASASTSAPDAGCRDRRLPPWALVAARRFLLPPELHRTLPIVFAVLFFSTAPSSAATDVRGSLHERKMLRIELDNDILLDSDDGFTAGWSVQVHSALLDTWPAWLTPLARLPGLGDDGEGGRVVRWAYGLSQVIVTPRDITRAEPQPEDAPWAGLLGVFGSWTSGDNRRLGALQVYLGCMGPCAQAEPVQRFIHDDLGLSASTPAGWDNQLADRLLGNVNIAGRHKLWAPAAEAYDSGRWAADLSFGGQAGLGNLATLVQAQVELRVGWALPMGFTHTPDPPGIGVALDPVYVEPRLEDPPHTWRAYGSVVVRGGVWGRLAPARGGPTRGGGHHPGVDPNLDEPQILFGLHLVRLPVALRVTYYRYLLGHQKVGVASTLDWINLSFELRF